SGLRGVSLGDVTGDGRDEVAFCTSNGGLDVWSWVSPGVWQEMSGTLPSSGGFRYTQLVDMDLDGSVDLVAYAPGEPGMIMIYGGDGSGGWGLLTSVTMADSCGYAAFRAGTDADHNGYPDMAVVAEEDCQWLVGGTNTPHFYAENTTPSSLWIHPQYPRGGETLVAGSVHFVDWSASVPAGQQTTVEIELSLAGVSGPWIELSSGLPNNGRYQWLLSPDLPGSTDCYLLLTMHSSGGGSTSALTPQAFTIVGQEIEATGDSDGDGDVDLDDHAALYDCLTGPGGGLGPGCAVFDWADDFDVDLEDAAEFQRVFTGPQ
ncbi:MAG: FG-GAP repeat domain-containing protein, partial [Planctomycetota bacterium]